MQRTRSPQLFDRGVNALLVVTLIVILVPLLYVVQISFTPLQHAGKLLLSPLDWSFGAYSELVTKPAFLKAALNSVIITVVGVLVNMVLTILTAYPLANRGLPGGGVVLGLIVFTFLFNAGIIPTYLLVKDLGLPNTLGAVVLPLAISVYNLLVVRSFFMNIPQSLKEAAYLDGASEWQVLWHVILPLSKPVLLTIAMFYAIAHWNEFIQPLLYLTDGRWTPLPVLLRDILTGNQVSEYASSGTLSTSSQESIQMAAVVLITLPMLLVYPWIQRHFTKGALMGGVKE